MNDLFLAATRGQEQTLHLRLSGAHFKVGVLAFRPEAPIIAVRARQFLSIGHGFRKSVDMPTVREGVYRPGQSGLRRCRNRAASPFRKPTIHPPIVGARSRARRRNFIPCGGSQPTGRARRTSRARGNLIVDGHSFAFGFQAPAPSLSCMTFSWRHLVCRPDIDVAQAWIGGDLGRFA
jgi:hypothetical protein